MRALHGSARRKLELNNLNFCLPRSNAEASRKLNNFVNSFAGVTGRHHEISLGTISDAEVINYVLHPSAILTQNANKFDSVFCELRNKGIKPWSITSPKVEDTFLE